VSNFLGAVQYRASDYYLFERAANLSREDVQWAKENGILTIAAINKFHYRNSADAFRDAQKDCEKLRSYGVTNFQIDSEYRRLLVK
jgi:glycerophosphoryl diester phosphodiesterase